MMPKAAQTREPASDLYGLRAELAGSQGEAVASRVEPPEEPPAELDLEARAAGGRARPGIGSSAAGAGRPGDRAAGGSGAARQARARSQEKRRRECPGGLGAGRAGSKARRARAGSRRKAVRAGRGDRAPAA